MTKGTIILLLTFLSIVNCFGQAENNKRRVQNVYTNWMSIEYLNCLKTDLPCECEKSGEYFLVSLDTAQKTALLYGGRTNYDYHLYDLKKISQGILDVNSEEYSQVLTKNIVTVISQIKLKDDTLIFNDAFGKQTAFILYNIGANDAYFTEHLKLLNSTLAVRGYDNLNKMLQSKSLKCWCNWELNGGINMVSATGKDWILEKKENELYISEWTNPPSAKSIDLKIDKKLIKKLRWEPITVK